MGNLDLSSFLIYVLIFIIIILVIIYNASKLGFEVDNSLFDQQDIDYANSAIREAKTYGDLELALEEATKQYIVKYYPELSKEDLFIIQIENLVSEGYIDKVKDIKNIFITCGGYVTVYNLNNDVSYNAYIKCGISYTTPGFNKRYNT